MILKKIHLQNFRNYSSQEFTFTEGIEDNFYTHLLDWSGSLAALGTKNGLNLFRPLKYNQIEAGEIENDSISIPINPMNSHYPLNQKYTHDKIKNLLSLKFK